MKAKETIYKGYRFRSRLEARYAVFFDTLGIKYEYEHQDYIVGGKRYLPDFRLPQQDCFVEIKGENPTKEECTKARLLALLLNKPVYIFYDSMWIPGEDDTYENDRYGNREVIETLEKGAYCYDPSDVSLTVDDTASPCYKAQAIRKEDGYRYCESCGKEEGICSSHAEIYPSGSPADEIYGDIHLDPSQDRLMRAVYMAEILSPYGDSCKLRLDMHGKLQYLAPRYERNHEKGKQYLYIGRTPEPMPRCIAECKREFEKLLAQKPNTWEWGMGSSAFLCSEFTDVYRWRECPFCGKFWITPSEKIEKFPCYRQHEMRDELYPIFYDSSISEYDRTPRLIDAYTAARQARFEHGESPH